MKNIPSKKYVLQKNIPHVACGTFSNEIEKHVLVGTDFEVCRKSNGAGTDVPEENTECIDIDAMIILTSHKLGCHV